tara:strand:- start:177 stop:473 length:297 start_codon:yes stop_codon:yes gene_type:complete
MKFIKVINNKKFFIISAILFSYTILNFLEGERGLISFYNNKKIMNELQNEKVNLIKQLNLIEKKNSLLTDMIDIDYLETLYRQKFMVGKPNEKIYKIN